MFISISDAAGLKREIAEKFSVQIHFHDGCGGQYFTIENPTEELKEYIRTFFARQNANVLFSENGEQFSVKEIS